MKTAQIIGTAACIMCTAYAAEHGRETTMQTNPANQVATLEFVGHGETDILQAGALIFTDRKYVVTEELPELLSGKRFLRRSIDAPTLIRFTRGGIIHAITPDPGDPKACAQGVLLERYGFERVNPPETFQFFGKSTLDIVRLYRKQVEEGEILPIRKYIVLAGFATAVSGAPAEESWADNRGERLYNGIVLPEIWPPVTINMGGRDPMPVPYLESRPDVIPIDVGRQLFVDDFLIEKTTLERTFHMPNKYEGNPILKPETALEVNGEWNAAAVPKSGGVWWDPAEKVFKMWYEAGWIGTICYATSKDGLTWERPELDVNPGTNQVLPTDLTPDSWTVVPNWDAADPKRRYTMRLQPPGKTQPGWCMVSSDGIHWTERTPTGPAGDRSTHFYNPFRKKWVHSVRSGGRGRARAYWEGDDFLADASWGQGEPVPWAMADDEDPPDPDVGNPCQLYNLDAVAYESIMLGMFEIHRGPENNHCQNVGLPKITELNFAYSRDGFHWHRPDRRTHIAAERRDVWDRGYVQSIGNVCTIQGDRLWIYYTAFQGDAKRLDGHWRKNGMYDRAATGVAFLRRDGFASLDAGDRPGTLTTRPVTFSGTRLFVNAVVPEGALRAEILDVNGVPIAPFSMAESVPFKGDSTLQMMGWNGGADLASLRGRPVRFRFELTNGSLYAFWVSRDDSGRSDGYVAGGGPGYKGHTDTVGKAALAANSAESPAERFLKPAMHVGPPKSLHAATNRAFQGIPSLAVTPGGRLWATWYAGKTPGEDHNNYVVLSTSGDNGKTWREVLVVDPDEGGPVRTYDPNIWMAPDGMLRLFWAQTIGHDGTVAGVWALEITNPESEDPEYGRPKRITDGVMMCKPLVLSTGEWALPASTWRKTDDSARIVVSGDEGRTWTLRGGCNVPVKQRAFDEHMFIERTDGSIWLLARTRYGIGESISTDQGVTWPELTPTQIAHPSARFFITRLNSGNLLLVKHGPITERTARSHLTAYLSEDDGRTWTGGLLLDERRGVSYPDGQQSADGIIRIVYDYSRTGSRHILMAAFREEDVAAGKPVSSHVKLRRLVSEASGGLERKNAPPGPVKDHKDGDPMKREPAGILAGDDAKTPALAIGATLFTDRGYVLAEDPEALARARFVQVPIDGTKRVRCTRAGWVYFLTPQPDRNRDTQSETLLKLGFHKVALPEVRLFNTGNPGNYCTLYQKHCAQGEIIEFGKWAVPLFFPEGK